MEQEVLLTYRLLFGQSSRSRKLARYELDNLEHEGRPFDGLLRTLCGRKRDVDKLPTQIWPVWCRDIQTNRLRENDVYNARSDFPRLGYRLVQLQKFSLRQTPNRLTDLWRDRRSLLQWYTFWAVLWIGGAATFLAFVQVTLQAVQLSYGTGTN
jgi:hypothetical protein